MRWLICLLTLTFGCVSASAEAFRVTGVFGRPGALAAMVETEAGYSIVRADDQLAGGRVAEVVPEGIRLERAGAVKLVRLSGADGPGGGAGTPEKTITAEMPPRGQALEELGRVERAMSGDQSQDWAAAASALQLPEGVVITRVNEESVRDAKDALRQVREALEREEIPGLTVDGAEGRFRVYVTPADAGMPLEPE